MNKLWSFLLFLIAATIVIQVLLVTLEPVLPLIVAAMVIISILFIGWRIWRVIVRRRNPF